MRGLPFPAPLPRGITRVLRYAAIATVGTAFFFFLHFLGNQTPHSLISERVAMAEMDPGNHIIESPFIGRHEYCNITSLTLGGSKRHTNSHAVRDAVLLQRLGPAWYNACLTASLPVPPGQPITEENSRYWFGSKAVYAAALRWISIVDFYELIRNLIYFAYITLGVSLLLLGMKRFLVGLPIVIAGIFFAANQNVTDIFVGIPHLWTISSVAVITLLFRWEKTRRFVPVCAFITGMVSSYFWIFDGHTILAIPALGLIGWLGYNQARPRKRMWRSLSMIGLYIAGFSLAFTLGLTAKATAASWTENLTTTEVFASAIENTNQHLERTAIESSAGFTDNRGDHWKCFGCQLSDGWKILPVIREFRAFRALFPGSIAAGQLLGFFSVLALVIAGSAAAFLAVKRRGGGGGGGGGGGIPARSRALCGFSFSSCFCASNSSCRTMNRSDPSAWLPSPWPCAGPLLFSS